MISPALRLQPRTGFTCYDALFRKPPACSTTDWRDTSDAMSLDDIFIPLIVAITTSIAYLAGRRFVASSRMSLADAVRGLMECIGAFLIFLCLNVVSGVALILLVRSITPRFVSLYALQDVLLIILSAVQGLLFRFWWR